MPTQITAESQIPSGKVVIDFFASWCGPCKRIAPMYEELSKKFPSITFLKVDVDEAEELASSYHVKSLPTFVFLINNECFERVEGANLGSVIEILEKIELTKPQPITLIR